MKQNLLFGKHQQRKMPAFVLLALTAFALASCADGRSTSTDSKQESGNSQDDPDTLGTVEDDPVNGGGGTAGGETQPEVADPDAQGVRIGLIVDSTQRCAKVDEPLQVVLTRKLVNGEEPSESGELPNVTGLATFDQSYGTSLNLISRSDDSANFEMNAQDIVGLTSSIENGSVTIFIAGYEPESPQQFIMRKRVADGCLYAFKSGDHCSTGLAKAGSIAFSRNGVSMTATGCDLDNPDDLPVLEVPATGG